MGDRMTKQQEYERIYEELIGFTPPRIHERIKLGLEVDPDLLEQVERIRESAMYPKCMDNKTAQMILFAVGGELESVDDHIIQRLF